MAAAQSKARGSFMTILVLARTCSDIQRRPVRAKTKIVIKLPRSRGDSGALYLQSAPAGVMPCLGPFAAELPFVSGVDVWVLRNGNP